MSEMNEPKNPSPKNVASGDVVISSSARVTAFGRVDTRDALDRAAESTRELERLRAVISTLTNDELSAYSAKGLSIGSLLSSKGHAFSVLTDEMLAQVFKDELEARKVASREGWRGLLNTPIKLIAFIGGIAAIVGLLWRVFSKI